MSKFKVKIESVDDGEITLEIEAPDREGASVIAEDEFESNYSASADSGYRVVSVTEVKSKLTEAARARNEAEARVIWSALDNLIEGLEDGCVEMDAEMWEELMMAKEIQARLFAAAKESE